MNNNETKKIFAQAEPAKLADAELEIVAGGRFADGADTTRKTSGPTVCCWGNV